MINNLFQQQLKKIKAAIAGLHEDLQYDLLNDLKNVQVVTQPNIIVLPVPGT